jgi:hypothetical protein
MFFIAFIVQLNPFPMTLRRKNLLSKSVVVTIYGIGLVFGIVLSLYEFSTYTANGFNAYRCQNLFACLATLLRLGPRLPIIRYVQGNKYVLWLLLGYLMSMVRSMFDKPLSRTMVTLCMGMRLITVALGIWKGWLRQYLLVASKND